MADGSGKSDVMLEIKKIGRCHVLEQGGKPCEALALPHWSVCINHAIKLMLVDVPVCWWEVGHVYHFRPNAAETASVLFVPASVGQKALAAAWQIICADRTGEAENMRAALAAYVVSIEDADKAEKIVRGLSNRPPLDREEGDENGPWPPWTAVESWAANLLFARGWMLYPPQEDEENGAGVAASGTPSEEEDLPSYSFRELEVRVDVLTRERDKAREDMRHAYDVAIRWETEARNCWNLVYGGSSADWGWVSRGGLTRVPGELLADLGLQDGGDLLYVKTARGWVVGRREQAEKLDAFAEEMTRRADEIQERSARLVLEGEDTLEHLKVVLERGIATEKDVRVRRSMRALRRRLVVLGKNRCKACGWHAAGCCCPTADVLAAEDGPLCSSCETTERTCRENMGRCGDRCCFECTHDQDKILPGSQVAIEEPAGLALVDDPGLGASTPVELGELGEPMAADEDADPGSDICAYCGFARVDHLGTVQRCPGTNEGKQEFFGGVKPFFVIGVAAEPGQGGDFDRCAHCETLRVDHVGDAALCPDVVDVTDEPVSSKQASPMCKAPECPLHAGHVAGDCDVCLGRGIWEMSGEAVARTAAAPRAEGAERAGERSEVEDPRGSETLYTVPSSLPFGTGFVKGSDLEQKKTETKPRCETGAKAPLAALTAEGVAEVVKGTLDHEKLVQYVVQWVKLYPCTASAPLRQVCEVYDAWRKSAPMSGSVNVCESLEGIRRSVSERRWFLNGSPENHQAVIGGIVVDSGSSYLATYKANAWLERGQLVFVTRLVDAVIASLEGDVRVLEVESFGLVRAGIVAALAGPCDHVRSVDPWSDCIELNDAAAGYRRARDRAVKVALEVVEGLVRS